jgi:hypothetical protein
MTTNLLTTNSKMEKWNQWFAGVTDGDGCFYINKKDNNSISYEITTHTTDIRVLYSIKNTLKTGTIKKRSGSQSVRYRIKQKAAIIEIVNRLNGRLYNQMRLNQFKKVCTLLNIPFIPSPPTISKQNAYLSGLIDADGSFTISVSKSTFENSQTGGLQGRIDRLANARGFCQISAKVTSIDSAKISLIQSSYDFGTVYVETPNLKNKSPKPKYHWTITSYDDFKKLANYLKINPLKSVKMHRMRLVFFYFKYKDLGYHLKPINTVEFQIWFKFAKSWFKYSF